MSVTGVRPQATFEEVAGGVFAYVQPDGGWCLSNAGILAGPDAVTLIDTAATERRALALRETVRSITAAPVRRVVNTHHHGDHTFGNFVFSPEATIIAHERARSEIEEKGLGLCQVWPDVEWGDIAVTPPSVTFSGRLSVHVGETVVDLIHLGPAHTTDDIVAWLPEQRVLFTGDLVMSGCTPFVLMGSLAGSREAVRQLRALRPRTVVCGHGPVCGPEVFDTAEAYLRWTSDLAVAAHKAGLSPLEAAKEADLGDFAALLDAERLVANLHRAYAELDGAEPGAHLPSAPVFREMVEFNGGRPLECRA